MSMADDGGRLSLLQELCRAGPAIHEAHSRLAVFPWDVPAPLHAVSVEEALAVLERHARSELTDDDLHFWTEAIEVREDIELVGVCRDCIFDLTSPELTGLSTAEMAGQWIARLSAASR